MFRGLDHEIRYKCSNIPVRAIDRIVLFSVCIVPRPNLCRMNYMRLRACEFLTHPCKNSFALKMARDLSRLVPSINFSNNFVSMEHFRGQQLEDAVNCSQKFASLRPLKEDTAATSFSEYCSVHPQMKLDLFCKQCGVDMCRECTTTRHRRHEYTASSDKIHEETRRLGGAINNMVGVLEDMKQAISGVKEMKQKVRNRKDNNINVTREVFATLRKAIDEKEEQTTADIEEEAYKREKALEVSHLCLNKWII